MTFTKLLTLTAILFAYVALQATALTPTTKRPKCVTNCTQLEAKKFDEFKQNFTRSYDNATSECQARNNFCKAYRAVTKNNNNKNSTFKMALTATADKSEAARAADLLSRTGLKVDADFIKNAQNMSAADVLKNTSMLEGGMGRLRAESLRLTGAASETNYGQYTGPVKDQGDCGSCWSFCANAVLTFQGVLTQKKLLVLSEQNQMDCNSQGYREWSYILVWV
jgi:C1A family cysteine protease